MLRATYLFLLLYVPLCQPTELVVLTQQDDTAAVDVPAGATIEVRLEGNPTSSYEWVYIDDIGFSPISNTYEPFGIINKPGGTYIFIFKPGLHHAGKAYLLTFAYCRKWLNEYDVADYIHYTINITKP